MGGKSPRPPNQSIQSHVLFGDLEIRRIEILWYFLLYVFPHRWLSKETSIFYVMEMLEKANYILVRFYRPNRPVPERKFIWTMQTAWIKPRVLGSLLLLCPYCCWGSGCNTVHTPAEQSSISWSCWFKSRRVPAFFLLFSILTTVGPTGVSERRCLRWNKPNTHGFIKIAAHETWVSVKKIKHSRKSTR